ncbi:MAG: lipopolysaccharide assembly protein LapA domain-containing protein [Pseudomonadota bacterium]
MKYVLWIISLPLTIVIVVFALANQQSATIDLWPFGLTVPAPVYLIVLLSLLVGFLLGGLVAWLSAGRARSNARHARHEAQALSRENDRLKKQSSKGTDGPETAGLPAVSSGA